MADVLRSKAKNLWFCPGMVILRAKTLEFQVPLGILSTHSSVFEDLFTLPQPPPGESEVVDGIPVVELHDNPEQLQTFLNAIFDPSFFLPPPAVVQLDSIIAVLRLSHKYDVPYLHRRALKHLDAAYPSELSAYDRRPPVDWKNSVAAIQTATEEGELWLLPCAYYDLCSRPIVEMLSSPKWNALGEEQRQTAIVGHSTLVQLFPTVLGFLHGRMAGRCEDPLPCYRVRADLASSIFEKSGSATRPLEAYTSPDDDDSWDEWHCHGVCTRCIEDAKAQHAEARQDFWDGLTEIFGLPEWGVLKDLRQTQLAS
ncbi:hypothetical protein FB45DRAFT_1060393 [Roridomyces roridus]|uniref:BTB domain-containing protein n=1 Tax=Roridomyces roridus TaxID=1738132 RepID=A0AAD7BMU4_9AGAR|nr:hypothetical protein FB45DRAFT_1060393 [Roridomyces roridus]